MRQQGQCSDGECCHGDIWQFHNDQSVLNFMAQFVAKVGGGSLGWHDPVFSVLSRDSSLPVLEKCLQELNSIYLSWRT